MVRVGVDTLRQLDELLSRLRQIDGLTEKSPGVFYSRRIPMLHFHDGDEGPVADLKRLPPERGFDRFETRGRMAQKQLLAETVRRTGLIQIQRKAKP